VFPRLSSLDIICAIYSESNHKFTKGAAGQDTLHIGFPRLVSTRATLKTTLPPLGPTQTTFEIAFPHGFAPAHFAQKGIVYKIDGAICATRRSVAIGVTRPHTRPCPAFGRISASWPNPDNARNRISARLRAGTFCAERNTILNRWRDLCHPSKRRNRRYEAVIVPSSSPSRQRKYLLY
jgi:hypothetical protein